MMKPRDEIFEQFLREYLRLTPKQSAFARRVLQGLTNGLSLNEAIRAAAN